MINIAVCDNDIEEVEKIGKLLDKWTHIHKKTVSEIKTFISSEKLAELIKKGKVKFDIYILDIIMPDFTGIDLGKIIREKDKKAKIIYTTETREYAVEAFGVNAVNYLIKPVEEDRLYNVIDEAAADIENRNEKCIITIKGKGGVLAVDMDEIIYVENVSRVPVYNLNNGTDFHGRSNRGTFDSEIFPVSSASGFISPHKSFYVNMKYIRIIEDDMIALRNGTKIPITRNKRAEVKSRFLKYLINNGGK